MTTKYEKLSNLVEKHIEHIKKRIFTDIDGLEELKILHEKIKKKLNSDKYDCIKIEKKTEKGK